MNFCVHCLDEGEWVDEDKCPKCEESGHISPWAVGKCPACNAEFYAKMQELSGKLDARRDRLEAAADYSTSRNPSFFQQGVKMRITHSVCERRDLKELADGEFGVTTTGVYYLKVSADKAVCLNIPGHSYFHGVPSGEVEVTRLGPGAVITITV